MIYPQIDYDKNHLRLEKFETLSKWMSIGSFIATIFFYLLSENLFWIMHGLFTILWVMNWRVVLLEEQMNLDQWNISLWFQQLYLKLDKKKR